MEIDAEGRLCTVVVTVDGDEAAIAEALEHARAGLRAFAAFDGFVAGATHVSADGTRIVQYLQWRREADHLACMNDPSWAESPSSRRFMEQARNGALSVKVNRCTVAAMFPEPT